MINKSYSSLSDSEARSGLSLVQTKGVHFTTLLFQAFNFVVGVAALPLRLFLRKNLGERTIRPGAFILSIALHIYYFTIFDGLLVIFGAMPILEKKGVGWVEIFTFSIFILLNPYFIFLVLVIIRGVKHFKQKIQEAKNNNIGYTYSRGESRFFNSWMGQKTWGFHIDELITRMIVEPRAVLKYGLVLFLFSLAIVLFMILILESKASYIYMILASLGCTGLVFAFDAICLFIDELALFLSKRDKVLDIIDSKVDATAITEERDKIVDGKKKIAESSANPLKQDIGIDDEEIIE